MHPQLRLALIMAAAAAIAAWLGIELAEGSLFWPSLAAAIALAAICSRLLGLPADLILLGFALVGYLVGNRGFAQLTPGFGLPLFPAEAVLLAAVTWRAVLCAFARELPWRKDPLNWIVLTWLLVGTVRLMFDVTRFGLDAVRDYAMVYYALFFLVVQQMMRSPGAERYLRGCLLVGLLILPPLYLVYQLVPNFFLDQLRYQGSPLIFYKGDLVHGFMIAGSVLLFFAFRGRLGVAARLLAIGLVLYVMPGDSRAAVVAALAVSAMYLAARRWHYPVWHLSFTVLAAVAVLGLAALGNNDWAEHKLDGAVDKFRSILDVRGVGTYGTEESLYKADNNRFRLYWWKNVAEETLTTNPVFGLGFGYDLAHGFLQEYSPAAVEEFTARSPHNIFLTAFGRMGVLGLAIWTALVATVFLRTWRALRRNDEPAFPLWTFCCVLLITATFGVVLEGPMAAMPFWTVLGMANALELSHRAAQQVPAETAATAAPRREPAPA